MNVQTRNTLLIIGGAVVVYYLYSKSKTGTKATATPNSTSGNGTPNNTNDLFGTIGGLIHSGGTIYNDVTNSSLIKGIFGGTKAPAPVTNSPSQAGATNNASNAISDVTDSLDTGGGDEDYAVPADSGNGSGLGG